MKYLIVVAALLSAACTAAYPRPSNPHYRRVGRLWYCYGPASPLNPGQTWTDDRCRPDPCGEMKMPEMECLHLGEVLDVAH